MLPESDIFVRVHSGLKIIELIGLQAFPSKWKTWLSYAEMAWPCPMIRADRVGAHWGDS